MAAKLGSAKPESLELLALIPLRVPLGILRIAAQFGARKGKDPCRWRGGLRTPHLRAKVGDKNL